MAGGIFTQRALSLGLLGTVDVNAWRSVNLAPETSAAAVTALAPAGHHGAGQR